MPTTFDKWFADGAWSSLLDQFGEALVYYPATGGVRSIMGIVDRDPPSSLSQAGNTSIPSYIVRVRNNCKTGISSHELNTGGDEIALLEKVGDVVKVKHSVMTLMSQDGGVCQLAVK